MRTAFATALLVILGLTSAQADTTYNYVGQSYVSGSPAFFGTNMTGSVTFNFDTTSFSGSISFLDGSGFITDVQLTSGAYTIEDTAPAIAIEIMPNPQFILLNGAIVAWDIHSFDGFACGDPIHGCAMASTFGIPNGGVDTFVQVCHFCNQGAVSPSPGIWSLAPAAVPGPVAGAGVPGLMLAGLIALWQRKRRNKH
jgi:hypothetical protein